MTNPKILFISRAYPPIFGGIENQNYGIAQALTKITPTKIIANEYGKKFLPVFLPWIMLKGLFIVPKYDVVLVGDGVLAPLCRFWKFFFRKKKYISIVHGLDITFANKKSILGRIYRAVNIPALRKMDKLIMVGNETIEQAIKFGIFQDKCVFIPNGIIPGRTQCEATKKDLEKVVGQSLEGKKVIFRGGRFVRHKGVEWFIRNVMPKLPENYILVAAGGGVAKKTAGDESIFSDCADCAKELDLEKRVRLIPNIPQPDMNILFNACDLYISPNIKVPGSMEGFGITAIEGGSCGRVVLASDLEGLKDAIIDGQNGFLLPPENTEAWTNKINDLLSNDDFRNEFGQKARQYVLNNFTWEKIANKYLGEIKKMMAEKK